MSGKKRKYNAERCVRGLSFLKKNSNLEGIPKQSLGTRNEKQLIMDNHHDS
jgi:hypothetical protein